MFYIEDLELTEMTQSLKKKWSVSVTNFAGIKDFSAFESYRVDLVELKKDPLWTPQEVRLGSQSRTQPIATTLS